MKNTPQLDMQVLQDLIADPKVLFFCSHSGGKDSQAMYITLRDVVPADRLIVIHADLGEMEWTGTFEHVQKYVTHELYKVKSEKSFFDITRERGMFPSGKVRFCTDKLKTDEIMKLACSILRERGFTTGVNCTGIRSEESPGRAGKPAFALNDDFSTKPRTKVTTMHHGLTFYDWMPIKELMTEDVYRMILGAGEELHAAYTFGMSRLSCCFCIMGSRTDMKISAQHNSELLEKYRALEVELGHTMFYDNGPISIIDYINKPYKRAPKKVVRLMDCMDVAN